MARDTRESNFQLDQTGIDWQVELSKRARAAGMRVDVGTGQTLDNLEKYFR